MTTTEQEIITKIRAFSDYSENCLGKYIRARFLNGTTQGCLYYNKKDSHYRKNDGEFNLTLYVGTTKSIYLYLEDHFLDPLEPTAMENELFKLEFGLDFIDIMEKLKYGE